MTALELDPLPLVVVAWCALALGFGCAGWTLVDIYGRRHRQHLPVMEAVWPLTAVYFGPLAVWAYRRFGHAGMGEHTRRPRWPSVAVSVSHCGAGCVLGDVIAEFVLFAVGASIAGEALFAEYVGDYAVAISFGIVFQYLVIAPTRGLPLRKGLIEAAKSDFIALSTFEIGLFGWMALMRFVFFTDPHLLPNSPAYWLFMQVGMIIGFATAWPANVWLIRSGVKQAM